LAVEGGEGSASRPGRNLKYVLSLNTQNTKIMCSNPN